MSGRDAVAFGASFLVFVALGLLLWSSLPERIQFVGPIVAGIVGAGVGFGLKAML